MGFFKCCFISYVIGCFGVGVGVEVFCFGGGGDVSIL